MRGRRGAPARSAAVDRRIRLRALHAGAEEEGALRQQQGQGRRFAPRRGYMSRKPEEPATGEDREAFASRWSRMKEAARQSPPQAPAEKAVDPKAPAPELTPVDKLTIDSDFRAFFHPKVEEGVRRAALKKLFSDPRFNVMDGLDTYIDDYSKTEPIPPAMLAGMKTAQDILRWAREDKEELEKREALKLK